MSRKPRILSSTGIYHIILRSVNQQIIFEEDSDYRKFLLILSDCTKKYDVGLYAYCLMDNHVHLLLSAPSDQLAAFFQSLGARFVLWYNKKYKRSGHLFQERFHSRAIYNEKYYLCTLLYIHNNPVKANACRVPSEYHWSSYNAFYGEKNPLVNTMFSYNIVGSKDSLLQLFSRNDIDSDISSELDAFDMPLFKSSVTDEAALEKFRELTGMQHFHEATNIPRKRRNEIVRLLFSNGLTQKQISRMIGISVSTIRRICIN